MLSFLGFFIPKKERNRERQEDQEKQRASLQTKNSQGPNFFPTPTDPPNVGSHHGPRELCPHCTEVSSIKQLHRMRQRKTDAEFKPFLPFPRSQTMTQDQRIKIKDDRGFRASGDERQSEGRGHGGWDGMGRASKLA